MQKSAALELAAQKNRERYQQRLNESLERESQKHDILKRLDQKEQELLEKLKQTRGKAH